MHQTHLTTCTKAHRIYPRPGSGQKRVEVEGKATGSINTVVILRCRCIMLHATPLSHRLGEEMKYQQSGKENPTENSPCNFTIRSKTIIVACRTWRREDMPKPFRFWHMSLNTILDVARPEEAGVNDRREVKTPVFTETFHQKSGFT